MRIAPIAPLLELALDGGRVAYQPGERLTGVASWSADASLRAMELRLFWYTKGNGNSDLTVAEALPFENPSAADRRPFALTLPDAPCSFDGPLFSLTWALELVALPAWEAARTEIVVGAGGRAVRL